MINKRHIQEFNNCKKYNYTDKEINSLVDSINFFIPTIRAFIKEYKITSPDVLRAKISDFVDFIVDYSIQSNYVASQIYELEAINSILKNPSIIMKEYPNIKDSPHNVSLYNANLSRSQRLALSSVYGNLTKLNQFAKTYDIKKDTDLDNVVINADNVDEIKRIITLTIKMLNLPNDKERFISLLSQQKKDCEKWLKETLVSSISNIYEFFNAFHLLDLYLDNYRKNSAKFGYPELEHILSTSQFNKDSIGLKELFSKDFLQTLSLNDLCFFNAFWFNRLSKESTNMFTAFSAIDSLGLWQDIINGRTKFNLSTKDLVVCMQKSTFISKLLRETFNMHQENITAKELNNGINFSDPNFGTKDFADYYSQLQNYIGENYNKYFSTYLKGENNLLHDFSFSAPFINLEQCAYVQKNDSILPLIKVMLDTHGLRNWGLVRNELVNGKVVDSLSESKNKLLIAFDVEGFNMPFRFHINKEDLMDLLKLSSPSYIIPEYQGADDFIVNNEVIPSNIIMPIPTRHKQTIINNSSKANTNNKLWQHFYFLMNGRLPKHFTQTIRKNRKQSIEARIPITYTDIRTNKRYTKNNNKFVEVDDYAR